MAKPKIKPEKTTLRIKQPVKFHHRKLFGIKYPKFLILFLTFVIAYFIFVERNIEPVNNFISSLGYLGSFIVGAFYTYGFSSAPAAAIFLILGKTQNIFLAAILGGFGALIGDLIIFKLIRTNFDDEIRMLEREPIVKYLDKVIPKKINQYITPLIGAIVIGSPLPDEIGVSLIAISRRVSQKTFIIISYVMNTLGIFILLWIGSGL